MLFVDPTIFDLGPRPSEQGSFAPLSDGVSLPCKLQIGLRNALRNWETYAMQLYQTKQDNFAPLSAGVSLTLEIRLWVAQLINPVYAPLPSSRHKYQDCWTGLRHTWKKGQYQAEKQWQMLHDEGPVQ